MTEKERNKLQLADKVIDLLCYHLIVWKNWKGDYELCCSKREAYKWLYELRREIHENRLDEEQRQV